MCFSNFYAIFRCNSETAAGPLTDGAKGPLRGGVKLRKHNTVATLDNAPFPLDTSRKEKSLGLLCQRLVSQLLTTGVITGDCLCH